MDNSTATPAARRPVLPPAYFLIALIAMAALHLATPVAIWNPWPWTVTGALPIVIGLGIAVAGNRHFKRVGTTISPFESSSQLVTDGIFAWSRNPMYLGMLLILAGVALGLGSVTPLFVPPLFLVIIQQRFIRHEERALEQQFGPAYHEYASTVRRWL